MCFSSSPRGVGFRESCRCREWNGYGCRVLPKHGDNRARSLVVTQFRALQREPELVGESCPSMRWIEARFESEGEEFATET